MKPGRFEDRWQRLRIRIHTSFSNRTRMDAYNSVQSIPDRMMKLGASGYKFIMLWVMESPFIAVFNYRTCYHSTSLSTTTTPHLYSPMIVHPVFDLARLCITFFYLSTSKYTLHILACVVELSCNKTLPFVPTLCYTWTWLRKCVPRGGGGIEKMC